MYHVYSFFVFYRGQRCVYAQHFARAGDAASQQAEKGKTSSEEDSLYDASELALVYGLLSTMKSLSQQVARSVNPSALNSASTTSTSSGVASSSASSQNVQATRSIQAFNSYTTSQYKLHCLEIPSGYFFVCLTEPNSLVDLRDYMRQIYQGYFVPLVLQSPAYADVPLKKAVPKNSQFAREVTGIFKRINQANQQPGGG